MEIKYGEKTSKILDFTTFLMTEIAKISPFFKLGFFPMIMLMGPDDIYTLGTQNDWIIWYIDRFFAITHWILVINN